MPAPRSSDGPMGGPTAPPIASFVDMIKTAAKRILENHHLLEPAHHILRHIERPLGRLDREIARRYLRQSRVRKLHIGCGTNPLPSWLNADYIPSSREIMYLDAARPFPFEDNAFDYVFSEHMIEHISYQHGLKMLTECRRVLKTFGKIRISTPDLGFLLNLCRTDKSALQANYIAWVNRTYIQGEPEDNEVFVLNNFVRNWGHTFIYDVNTLKGAMMRCGFTNIVECDLQESEDAMLCNLENEARMPPGFLRLETLTLEGTRSS